MDALAALRQVVGVLLVGQSKMGIGPDEEMAGKLTAERGLKTEGQRTALVKGIQGRVRIGIDVVGVVLNAERQHRTEASPVSVR